MIEHLTVPTEYHTTLYQPGWYFWDEAAYLHGPFSSKLETEMALYWYLREELGE